MEWLRFSQFCESRYLNIDHRYKYRQRKVYINGIEGFWSFAKERLMKHYGISKENFSLLPQRDGVAVHQ
jgi:hypothetical protein